MKASKIIATAAIALATLSQSAHAKDSTDMKNQKIVMKFYQELFGDKDVSAIDRYLTADYIQHNPSVADGREPLKAAASQWFNGAAKEKVDIQHVASQGGIVFLHVRSKNESGGVQAIVDIFRVKNGKIAEHWDVIQDAPATSANPHPMF